MRKDTIKLKKFAREHNHANMARRKANEHAKLRKELDLRYRNIAKNMKYSPTVGCDTVGQRTKPNIKVCKHKLYGCTGGLTKSNEHLIQRSKYCTFCQNTEKEIDEIRSKYFLDHPEAKLEYDVKNGAAICKNRLYGICKHRLYGCIGEINKKKAHSTENSKWCTFKGKTQ